MCSLVQEEGLGKGARKQASKWFLPESEVVLPGLYSKSVSGVENREGFVSGGRWQTWRLHGAACTVTSYAIWKNAEVIGSAVGKPVYKTCI